MGGLGLAAINLPKWPIGPATKPIVISTCDTIKSPISSKIQPANIMKESAITNIIAVFVFLSL